jgi:hypothetical protein
VLVVEDDAGAALEVPQMLRECGYEVVGPTDSLEEAQRLIDPGQPPILCALIDACLPGACAIADALGVRGLPVVWIASGSGDAFSWDRRQEPVLRNAFSREELRDAIEHSVRVLASRRWYASPPPQSVWPRVFPQL